MTGTDSNGTLELCFQSDWHVGDGAGQHGLIDRIIRRDPVDRLPYIPAKTLTGIWRDACERVALGLDAGAPGGWCAWVEALFGDEPARREALGRTAADPPRAALLSVRPARLGAGLRGLLAASPRLRDALTFVKPGVRIDRVTGQAKTDHLRFDEVVRAGAVLQAPVTLMQAGDEAGTRAALALLWAGARTVERLGGKRRRGAGRCTWTFPLISDDDALALLAADPPETPAPAAVSIQPRLSRVSGPRRAAGGPAWYRLPLWLAPQTPLVIPRAVVGNLVESHDFVPGTHLLGPLTRSLRQLGIDPFPWAAAGLLRVCHAYPVVGDASPVRGRPVPMAIAYDKGRGGLEQAGGRVRNRFREGIGDAGDAQWKPYRGGYLGVHADGLPGFVKPALMVAAHAAVDDQTQCPTEEVVGVYSYQAIRPDTALCGELRVCAVLHDALCAKRTDWWRALAGEVRLGRARKDDYGLAELQPGPPEPESELAGPTDARRSFVVWLLSDLLLRDDLLQPATTLEALRSALERALPPGSGLASVAPGPDRIGHLLRTRRSDGWHQGWGLPRPSYVGIAAGSCAAFEVSRGTVRSADLRALVQRGLGERRAEGLGELAIDDPLLLADLDGMTPRPASRRTRRCCPDHAELPSADAGAGMSGSPDAGDGFLSTLRIAALRRRIRDCARIEAANPGFRTDSLHWGADRPGNSQLGNLRRVLARFRGPGDQGAAAVTHWVGHVRAAGRWPDDALDAVAAAVDPARAVIWDWLRIPSDPRLESVFIGLEKPGIAELKAGLWAEAVRTLFAAAVHATVRERERPARSDKTPEERR